MALPRNAAEWDAYWADPSNHGAVNRAVGASARANGNLNYGAGADLYVRPSAVNRAVGGNKKNVRTDESITGYTGGPRGLANEHEKGGGGVGGWFGNLLGDVVEMATGIPGAIKLGSQFVGGVGGMLVTGGQWETPRRWLQTSGETLGEGFKQTGAAWGDLIAAAATGGKKGDARYFFEDPGYLALDIAALATLGSAGTVRGAAAVNQAARARVAKAKNIDQTPSKPQTYGPNRTADTFGNQLPVNSRRKTRAIRDLNYGELLDIAGEARSAARPGKRTNRNPNASDTVDPSNLSRRPGTRTGGRIMRRDYLAGRDLVADPLSRMEQIALRTNWARLQPTKRFSPFRQAPVWNLDREQVGLRNLARDVENVENNIDGGIQVTGRRRSAGPLRRGVQNLIVNDILGPTQRRVVNRQNQRAQTPGIEGQQRASRLENFVNPFGRAQRRNTRQLKRGKSEWASTQAVQAGSMPLAASIRELKKSPELSYMVQELVQVPPRASDPMSMRRAIEASRDRKRELFEASDGPNDPHKLADFNKTMELTESLLDPKNPVWDAKSKQYRRVRDAVNNIRRWDAEFRARGLDPANLLPDPRDRNRRWRNPSEEARTGLARIVHGGAVPLGAAGKDGHARVVDVQEYLRREGEARFDPVGSRSGRQFGNETERRVTARKAARNQDTEFPVSGDEFDAVRRRKRASRTRFADTDVSDDLHVKAVMSSGIFSPGTAAWMRNIYDSGSKGGKLSPEEINHIINAGGVAGQSVTNVERGLVPYINNLAVALKRDYERVSDGSLEDRWVRRGQNHTPITTREALARLDRQSLKEIKDESGNRSYAAYNTRNLDGTDMAPIPPVPRNANWVKQAYGLPEDNNVVAARANAALPDQAQIDQLTKLQRADRKSQLPALSGIDLRTPLACRTFVAWISLPSRTETPQSSR